MRRRRHTRHVCEAVVHIGDSTSEGLVSTEYLPEPDELISAQYARVGATEPHLEVSGARSIHEQFEGIPNAQEVAEAWKEEGFEGCWVLAMGTNEAADVAAGSTFSYDDRIEQMMSTIGDEPVMWVNVKSLLTAGALRRVEHEVLGRSAAGSLRPLSLTCGSTTGPPTSTTPGSSKTGSTSPRRDTRPAAG